MINQPLSENTVKFLESISHLAFNDFYEELYGADERKELEKFEQILSAMHRDDDEELDINDYI